ncbi:MAG: hypothetical protein LLG00_17085 [Planctomycetaceae bacterium]|nr:hypothetical protein [Planctomycetaceae bacterium]
MPHLTLNPVFDSYLLVAVIGLALAGLLWFGPSRQRTGRWQRVMLAMLRAAVVALVAIAMLRPTLIYTQTKKQAATLIVLADQSRSMSVPDAVGGKTRWEALRGAVGDAGGALKKLTRDFELKTYTFDAELHDVAAEGGKLQLPDKPTGQQTAIGATLKDALDNEAGKRLLGVILLSDGAQRAYAPRDLAPQTAVARLKHLGYPLYAFPFGQSRGLGEAQDVAVKDLVVAPSVFVKNELSISGQVRVDGYVNVAIPVRVLFETSPGKMEVVGEQTIRPTADGQRLSIKIPYVPLVPGEHKLTLQAAEQRGELATTNNELSTFVNVLKGGLNVLYVEGALRVEEKFLRRALDSSPDVKVDYVRIDPRDQRTRPADFGDRFKPGKYDVYILGDIDSTAFAGDELARLADCVSRGAGLIMLGGFQTYGGGGYQNTPLGKVLPVGMDRFERQRPDEPVRTDLQWPGPLKMRPTTIGLLHFALSLAGNRTENDALWSKLPPLEGANRFHDLAPGAVVLADAGPDKPLLVAHSFGDGRVMAFAGDSTWRWWMRGYESAFKRFWRQIVLWLARKDQAQEGNVWVRLSQRAFPPADRVEFTAGANAPNGEPVTGAEYKAEVVLPDGARHPLTLVRQDHQMAGSFRDTQSAGDYVIEVTATQNGQPPGTARARFLVFRQDLELDNASADAATLDSLAAMTGGRSLAPENLKDLVRKLAEDTQHLDIQQETKKSFWDTWPFFLALVGLLSLEWYLRKRWGLV